MPAAKANPKRSLIGTAGDVEVVSAKSARHTPKDDDATAYREKNISRSMPCKRAAARSAGGKNVCSASITHIKVRSLLCHNCNRGLGLFGDSIEMLSKAVDYLRMHGSRVR